MSLPRAVIDTSFWTAAYYAEVAANCLDFFEIIVPAAVEQEIRQSNEAFPNREYPYATLFRQLRGRMVDPPAGIPPLVLFGPGEAEAIALAQSLDTWLLINEHRGMRYARRSYIQAVTVPEFVITLYLRGVISDRAARRKLEIIEPITVREFIADARRVLDGP
jgi:predicted nucleic acid-binding protein